MMMKTKKYAFNFTQILLALVLVGSVATAKPGNDEDTKLTKTITKGFVLPKNGSVELKNKYGQIVVNNSEDDSVRVSILVTAFGKDYSSANKILSRVDFDFDQTNQYITIETLLDRKSGFIKEVWNNIGDASKALLSKNKLEVDYEIYIPKWAQLNLENKFGDVYLHERDGPCEITVSHGNLRANAFNARANIEASFGDVKIKYLKSGNLTLKAAEADIQKIGEVDMKSSSSEIRVKEAIELKVDSRSDKLLRIGKINRLSGKGLFSKITVERLDRSIDMDMNYGEIESSEVVFNFSRIDISGRSTDIQLYFEDQSYVELDIEAKQEDLSLPVERSDVNTSYLDDKGKYVKVTGNIGTKNNYPGRVTIKAQGGDVDINFLGPDQSAKN
ncbi:MAG: hypothetical protein AAFX87_15480 [Bacteroidota bacterium]